MHQRNKQRIWSYYRESDASPQSVPALARSLNHEDVRWHGPHPLRRLDGVEALIERFWSPLLRAFPDLRRRPYLLLAGRFEEGDWVASTGDFIGTFARDWLAIPATGASVHFRYGEFHLLRDGRVAETRTLFDLLDLARQAGFDLVPPSPGVERWPPGPLAGDGVRLDRRDPEASRRTLELVEAMIFGGLNRYDRISQESQRLDEYWHRDMAWHGPVGVGSAYGLEAFKRDAQGPIVRAFPDRKGVGHRARIAEGAFAASTGWPSLVGTHRRAFLDWAPTGQEVGWNIMDFWKRRGDKLLENWVLIDLIDAGLQSGVDLLARLETTEPRDAGRVAAADRTPPRGRDA